MNRIHDLFLEMLNGFNLETFEEDPGTVFGLSADLLLIYFNRAWFSFARENEGEPMISEKFPLGAHLGDAIKGELRDYYLASYVNALQTGMVWHHDYECSSPDVLRIYHQAAYPLARRQGLAVVNSLVRAQPHDPVERPPHEPIEALYLQKTGLITQCSNCRRTLRASAPECWDWVPAWVEKMPENTSHSICKICFEYYYSQQAVRWRNKE
jgi:hypothetical protein